MVQNLGKATAEPLATAGRCETAIIDVSIEARRSPEELVRGGVVGGRGLAFRRTTKARGEPRLAPIDGGGLRPDGWRGNERKEKL